MKDNILEKLRLSQALKDWVGEDAFEEIKKLYTEMNLELLLYETYYYEGKYNPNFHYLEIQHKKNGDEENLENLKKSPHYIPRRIKSELRKPCIIVKNYFNEYYEVLVLKQQGDYGKDYDLDEEFWNNRYVVPHSWVSLPKD